MACAAELCELARLAHETIERETVRVEPERGLRELDFDDDRVDLDDMREDWT